MTENNKIDLPKLLEQWCKENGFDGFCNDNGPCGCVIGDIAPCGFPEAAATGECVGGYKGPGGHDADGNECEYLMRPTREQAEKGQIDD